MLELPAITLFSSQETWSSIFKLIFVSLKERYALSNEYSESLCFWFILKKSSEKTNHFLKKWRDDSQLILPVRSKLDIDGYLLFDELISLKLILPVQVDVVTPF